jgi:hypothetical protein
MRDLGYEYTKNFRRAGGKQCGTIVLLLLIECRAVLSSQICDGKKIVTGNVQKKYLLVYKRLDFFKNHIAGSCKYLHHNPVFIQQDFTWIIPDAKEFFIIYG